jgi:hypothetical protein
LRFAKDTDGAVAILHVGQLTEDEQIESGAVVGGLLGLE